MLHSYLLCVALVSASAGADTSLDVTIVDTGLNSAAAGALGKALQSAPVGVDAIASLPSQTLLVLIDTHDFPGRGFALVRQYVAKGGHLFVAGANPFEVPLYESDGRWVREDELLRRVKPEHPLVDWSKLDVAQCPRGSSEMKAYAKYARVDNGISGETDMADPLGWENVEIPCALAAPAGDDVLRFRASGSGRATALLIEAREKDGSRWMAVAPLSSEEREIGIHANVFKYWRDSSSTGRGGEGDHVHFENVRAIAVGFAQSHQPLSVGRYNYIVRGLATGKLGAGFVRPEPLKLEGMCPAYKTFTARPKRFESLDAVKDVRLDYPETVISPVARGMRADKDRDYVWQPLIKGYDADNVWCATPAATMWRKSGATWTYLGFSPKPDALAEMCRRLAASLAQQPAFEEGVGPLLDASPAAGSVMVEGDHFTLAGKRWFAHGINFWPLYVTGLEPTEYFFNWLAPQYYYPELVEQDLATLERLGINLVSVQYNKTEEAPQLRDFAARCGSHGVKVNVFLGTAHPISPSATDDLSKRPFVELLAAANLRGIPSVFGYDLAWEPIVGAYAARKMYDPLFEAWITEQYGSLEHAEKVWGIAVNRAEGKITGPQDKQLTEDGPHRVMVAAYRRFLDDLISHRYREVIRLARGIDPTHLFGVRSGYGGTGTPGVVPNMPFQLTSGAAHLDFISPEGYGYGPKNISDAALVNQYARWAGHGKPVFWAEFGLSVWGNGQPGLERQKDLYEAFASMALHTGAAGWAPWWYPGGYRVDEQSDYGIIAPDRTPRSSALVMQRMGPQLAKGGALPAGDALTFAHDGKPQGIAATVQELSKAFGEAYGAGRLPTLKTAGTGTASTDCPMTGVGDVAFEAPGPPEYLNAEAWVVKRENGRIRIALLNTGEATWKAEDCSALVSGASGTESIAIPKDVAPYAQIELECADPGAATVAVQSRRFGAFGERVAISAP